MKRIIILFLLIFALYIPAYAQDDDVKLILEDAQNYIEDGYFENGLSQLEYYIELSKSTTTPEIEKLYVDAWLGLENYMEAQHHIDLFLKSATPSDKAYDKIIEIAKGLEGEIELLKKQLLDWANTATKNGEPYNWDAHNGLLPVGFAPEFKWCGYIDKNGNAKTPFIYRVASHFENGIAYVDNRISGYKELIDSDSKVLVRLSGNIKSVYPFQDGYAGIRLKDVNFDKQRTYGIINEKGERIDKSGFPMTEIYLFSDDSRYPILKDGKFGAVSLITGKSIIDEEKYTIFSSYQEGYIIVRPKDYLAYELVNNDNRESSKLAIELLKRQGKNTLSGYAMLDQDGNEFIPMDDTYVYLEPFNDGYAAAAIKGKGYGVLNKALEEVLPFQYARLGRGIVLSEFVILDEGTSFGKARVYSATQDKLLSKSVETFSKRAAFPEFTFTYPSFVQNYMPLITKKGKVRYYDHDLNDVFDKDFVFAKDFSEGMASVMNRDAQAGYINENGELVVDYQYSIGQLFQQNLAAVAMGTIGSEKYGFINKQGDVVIPFEYDYAEPFFEATEIFQHYYSPKQLNLIGAPDISVTPLDITFDTNEVFFHLLEGKKLALVRKKDKLQFIDQEGKVWVERLWDNQEIKKE